MTAIDRLAEFARFLIKSDNLHRDYVMSRGVFTDDELDSLFSWGELNTILGTHNLSVPHFRLVRGGAVVPSELYSSKYVSRRAADRVALHAIGLHRELGAGATMVMDDIDHKSHSVLIAAMKLESVVRASVQVNLYASWSRIEGFSTHWDDHDVIVVNLEGQKNWAIFGPTRTYPLQRDVTENVTPPPNPVATLCLRKGDVLYIPRGWWHRANSAVTPSMHLTFGLWFPTGVTLLQHLSDILCSYEEFRADLPRFTDPINQQRWVDRFRKILTKQLDRPDLLQWLFAFQDALSPPRLGLSLPNAATADTLPEGSNWTVLWLCPRAVLASSDDSEDIRLLAGGEERTYSLGAARLLQHLVSQLVAPMSQLITVGGLSEKDARAVIAELVQSGFARTIV